MATPNLLLIPSGYKAGKLYSIIPSSGNGDLDFVRASGGTRTDKDGNIEEVVDNVPRLDYDGDCPALLVEPQRTNLLTYSNDFTNAAWGKTEATVSVDSRGQRVTWDATSGLHLLFQQTTYQANSVYTQTYILENDGVDFVQIYESGNAFANVSDGFVNYDLTNMTLVNNRFDDATISEHNGKIKITATLRAGATGGGVLALSGIPSMASGFRPSYTPDGVSGFYVSNAQLEAGEYSTSYIPTTTSSVTRIKGDFTTTFTTPFDVTTEGSFFFSMRGMESSNGVGNSSAFVKLQTSGSDYAGPVVSGVWRGRFTIGGITELNSSPVLVTDDVNMLLSFDSSGWEMWANGSKFSSGTDVFTLTSISRIISAADDTRGINAYKSIALYDTKLTEDEARELTQV